MAALLSHRMWRSPRVRLTANSDSQRDTILVVLALWNTHWYNNSGHPTGQVKQLTPGSWKVIVSKKGNNCKKKTFWVIGKCCKIKATWKHKSRHSGGMEERIAQYHHHQDGKENTWGNVIIETEIEIDILNKITLPHQKMKVWHTCTGVLKYFRWVDHCIW